MSTRLPTPPPSPPDPVLTERALAGDADAFAELFGQHEQGLYNVAYRLTGSPEDAADITQETFLRVFARLPELSGAEVNLAAYLHRTARNLVYDRSAERSREVVGEEIEAAAGADESLDADPQLSTMLRAQQSEVRAANARLPERHRLALALRELQGFDYRAIGEVLDVEAGSVGRLLARARMALRRELRLEQIDPEAMDPACERRLGAIAALIDGQLDADRAQELEGHLATCATCRAAREAFEDTGQRYRSWLPLPLLGLAAETARAAPTAGGTAPGPTPPPGDPGGAEASGGPEGVGESGATSGHAAGGRSAVTDGGSTAGAGLVVPDDDHGPGAGEGGAGRRRRRVVVGALAAAGLLIVAGVPTLVATRSDDPRPATAPAPVAAEPATIAPAAAAPPPATTGSAAATTQTPAPVVPVAPPPAVAAPAPTPAPTTAAAPTKASPTPAVAPAQSDPSPPPAVATPPAAPEAPPAPPPAPPESTPPVEEPPSREPDPAPPAGTPDPGRDPDPPDPGRTPTGPGGLAPNPAPTSPGFVVIPTTPTTPPPVP